MPLVNSLSSDEVPITVRAFFANGDPGPIVSTLAHVPELMKKTLPFIGAALGASGISLRTKEIVILRTSAQQACKYCVQTHCYAARHAGLSLEEVQALLDGYLSSDGSAESSSRETQQYKKNTGESVDKAFAAFMSDE